MAARPAIPGFRPRWAASFAAFFCSDGAIRLNFSTYAWSRVTLPLALAPWAVAGGSVLGRASDRRTGGLDCLRGSADALVGSPRKDGQRHHQTCQ